MGIHAVVTGERRDDKRHKAILRLGIVQSARGSDLCLVKNLSSGGLMARVHRDLPVGETLKFELREGQQLSGTLRWARDGHVGVEFDEPISVETILAVQQCWANGTKPRTPRFDVGRPGELHYTDHHVTVHVRNISLGGAGLDLATNAIKAGPVTLDLVGLPRVAGQIRWARDSIAGMSFNHSLPFDTLAKWLAERH